MLPSISVTTDPEIDAAFPAQRAARVTLKTKNGDSVSLFQPTRKGDPDMPLSDSELDAKFTELTAPVLGIETTAALLGDLWKLDTLTVRACLAHTTTN